MRSSVFHSAESEVSGDDAVSMRHCLELRRASWIRNARNDGWIDGLRRGLVQFLVFFFFFFFVFFGRRGEEKKDLLSIYSKSRPEKKKLYTYIFVEKEKEECHC